MWQRFTERARRVILLGQEEAGKLNSGHVGTEHLLLGLMRENEGIAAQVLVKMGVSLDKVRSEIEGEVQPARDQTSGEPKLTPKAKRVLELAADEGRRMRHNYIGTEHLLLALLREKDGLAATVLRRLGLNLEKARAQVSQYLGPDSPEIETDDNFPGESPNKPMHNMWLRFSQCSRRVILRAQQEAMEMQYSYVGSEHLLLGLLLESEGIAAHALEQQGVALRQVRQFITAQPTLSPPLVPLIGEPKLSPEGKRILELANDEARLYRQNIVGTKHILLALLREEDAMGTNILRSLGVNRQELRAQVLDYSGPREAPADPLREARKNAPAVPREEKPTLWKRLDNHAQAVMNYAQQEATVRRHAVVGSEHILLGLLSASQSVAAELLNARGVFLPQLRAAIKAFAPDGEDNVSEAKLDFNGLALLERAADETISLGRYAIGTEHLLLALLSDKTSMAAQIVHHLMSESSDLEARIAARLAPATELIDLPPQRLKCSPATVQVIEIATNQARRLGENEITPEILFAALLSVSDDALEAILKRAKKDIEAGEKND